jgi:hypothetical protein
MDKQGILKMIDKAFQNVNIRKKRSTGSREEYDRLMKEIDIRFIDEPHLGLHEIMEDVVYTFLVG